MVPDVLRDSLQVVREFNTPTADDLVELQKALVPQFENVLQKYIQGSVMCILFLVYLSVCLFVCMHTLFYSLQ